MADDRPDDAVMRRHLSNMEALRRFPGVTRVGFGLKESGGEVVPEWAYRVYVARKRPSAELAASEAIPLEIDGIKTDVLVGFPGDTVPYSAHTAVPGDQVRREIPNSETENGTFGLLVRKDSTRFLLTNDHVLDDRQALAEFTRDIYSPGRKTIAGLQCNKPLSHIVDSHGVKDHIEFETKKFYVDATIAPLYEGRNATNVVPGIGALDQGLRDLVTDGSTTPPVMVHVAKRGAVTGVSKGTVVEFFHDAKSDDHPEWGTFVAWELGIRPDADAPAFSEQVELAPGQDIDHIKSLFANEAVSADIKQESGHLICRLSGRVFSRPGDSGSCVVDDARRIVGLHRAGGEFLVLAIVNGETQTVGLSNGRGVAAYIRPVFSAMGLSETTGVVPPGSATAGATLDEARWEAPEASALDQVEKTLTASPAGRRLRFLWERFGEELAELVHHRRRVLVVWYRAQGPGYAAAFMRALGEPDGRLPAEIDGVRLADALARMRDVLLREGSPDLRQAIADHGPFILALTERATSIPDLMTALAEADDPCSPS